MARFYPKNRRKRGEGMTQAERNKRWRIRHPERHAARQRRWTKKNPDKAYAIVKKYRKTNPLECRNTVIKRQFGIDNARYDEMLKVNNGGCWICSTKPLAGKPRLAIDHVHKSKKYNDPGGRVRGLLCHRCNRFLIGRYRLEHTILFERAAAYLRSEKDWRIV